MTEGSTSRDFPGLMLMLTCADGAAKAHDRPTLALPAWLLVRTERRRACDPANLVKR